MCYHIKHVFQKRYFPHKYDILIQILLKRWKSTLWKRCKNPWNHAQKRRQKTQTHAILVCSCVVWSMLTSSMLKLLHRTDGCNGTSIFEGMFAMSRQCKEFQDLKYNTTPMQIGASLDYSTGQLLKCDLKDPIAFGNQIRTHDPFAKSEIRLGVLWSCGVQLDFNVQACNDDLLRVQNYH